ncbi:MAG: purine-nucleoside phosphorylase [Trueperaceae bacterium]|nr:purine-nucleoside phosphorylase [Trueperaceae bacterium]MCO5175019.1 purine-nucleoside phosphorylase [Trueperaceae bacterium]MCW5819555.1 purine-nucleoside phosphorylase [Trueperaceae bacterium]
MTQLHVRAVEGSVAPIVLLPGDPDRATLVAERFLDGPKRYNTYRHLYGYTGTYQGVPVSVQATGMGCPSLAIVVEELVRLGAKTLVRIGTSGVVGPGIAPGDLIVASASVPNDGTTRQYLGGAAYSTVADFGLTQALARSAGKLKRKAHVGLIQTDDAFYAVTPEAVPGLAARGVLALEMEASALFLIGKLRDVRAGCMLVASNRIGDATFVEPAVLDAAILDMIGATLEACVEHRAQEREPGATDGGAHLSDERSKA